MSRLVKYKRIDIAVQAFNQLGWSLKIVGIGKEEGRLKAMAKKNIEFLGQLTEERLLDYYQKCSAVVFPPAEDFGLVPLEAQACGRPVLAFKAGGALETVKERKTGMFFFPQTPEALTKVLIDFNTLEYQSEDCRRNAERFSKELFKKKIKEVVKKEWQKHQRKLVF